MRAGILVLVFLGLTIAGVAVPASAAPGGCPLIASFATVCVNTNDCAASVRVSGGDRVCVPQP